MDFAQAQTTDHHKTQCRVMKLKYNFSLSRKRMKKNICVFDFQRAYLKSKRCVYGL